MLVSREFAEKNGLAVGGAFSVRRATVHAQMAGIDVEDTRTQVSVTGIFELTAKSRADLASWSMDNAIFGTISTLDRAREGTVAVGPQLSTSCSPDACATAYTRAACRSRSASRGGRWLGSTSARCCSSPPSHSRSQCRRARSAPTRWGASEQGPSLHLEWL